jgi:PPOX class probable F420-dependent enzyme
MARAMAHDEWRAFVLAKPARTAAAATTRTDGRPHVAPIWIDLDGDDVMFTTAAESVKGKALRRDPRLALAVDDPSPPFSFVIVEGEASISEDLDEMLRWATCIGGRYMGDGEAETYGRRNAVPGELLVRVTPTKIIAMADVAD